MLPGKPSGIPRETTLPREPDGCGDALHTWTVNHITDSRQTTSGQKALLHPAPRKDVGSANRRRTNGSRRASSPTEW